jgi:hypothetical protein
MFAHIGVTFGWGDDRALNGTESQVYSALVDSALELVTHDRLDCLGDLAMPIV